MRKESHFRIALAAAPVTPLSDAVTQSVIQIVCITIGRPIGHGIPKVAREGETEMRARSEQSRDDTA